MQHVVMPEVLIAERRRLGLDKQDEMWDGVLHTNLPGNTNHQRIERELGLRFDPLARQLGLELLMEAGLFDPAVEDNKSFWVPDLVVFPPSVASDRGVEGLATLAVEIRSPGDESFEKIPHYTRIGVAELLIIDRDTRAVRRWVAGVDGLAEVLAGEDGWHQLAALPAALRGRGLARGPYRREHRGHLVETGHALPAGSSAGLLETLAGFVTELRTAGIPVSLTENLDAMEALQHIPLEDRQAFKYALAATLVKNNAHWKAFETVFEVYFSLRGREYRLTEDGDGDGAIDELITDLLGPRPGEGSGAEGLTPEQLAELLYRALMDGNDAMMRAIARAAVTRYAGMEPGRPVGGTYYLYRTLRQLDLDSVLEKMMGAAREQTHGALTELEERLAREEYESRLDALRREIEAEIRRRLVADRGAEAVAKSLRKPLPEDIDFMHANREELLALRKAIAPLTRKLAVRLARKRRHGRKGPLDFRSTVRHSLSYGGVPAEPKFRYPRPSKPEIMVVADISGSVAAFARFTLQMVYAISSQFSRVRSFVFIDGIDEVTDFFKGTEDISAAIHRINTEADVVWVDGHSDYGHAFEVFWERWGREINSKTTVLLLGDARNNYHAAQAWVLAEIAKKARHIYWLNPEPRSYWDTGDSIVSQYATHCGGAYECRNLKQLERFVEQLG